MDALKDWYFGVIPGHPTRSVLHKRFEKTALAQLAESLKPLKGPRLLHVASASVAAPVVQVTEITQGPSLAGLQGRLVMTSSTIFNKTPEPERSFKEHMLSLQ